MTPKLTEAFSKHAAKLVDAVALDQAVFATLEKTLDDTEARAFMIAASSHQPMAANLPAGALMYVGTNSDGDNSIFMEVSTLEAAFAGSAGRYGSLQDKVEAAFADALDNAADYKAAAGKFQSMPIPRP